LSVELRQLEDRSVVRLAESVSLGSVAELHKLLIAALDSNRSIAIDLEAATELDVAGIQLLYAAWQAAEKAGVSVSVEGSVPRAVKNAFRDAGLDPFHVANGSEGGPEDIS
jgi:anti-anti-sigma regulatory factor